jgi:hypothetical protein
MHQYVRRYEPKKLVQMFTVVLLPPVTLAPLLHLASSSFSLVKSAFVSLAVYAVTLTLSMVVYRLSPWHPLAAIPGPFLARLSKFWMIHVLIKDGKEHVVLKDLHDKYGDFVRVGPNEISIRNVNAVVPVLGSTGKPI